MKKVILFFFLAVILTFNCSCSKSDDTNSNNTSKSTTKENTDNNTTKDSETKTSTYVDDNPIKVGLYIDLNGVTTLVDTYSSVWYELTDLIVFSTFYTQDKYLPAASVADTFDTYKNKYSNIDNYRIGYNLKYTTSDGINVNQTIKNIADTAPYRQYLQLYLYDDIAHRYDSWYSHITEDEFSASTMMTSLKITGSDTMDNINSDITVTVFTYKSSDDFDKDGNYRGNSKYTAVLKRA